MKKLLFLWLLSVSLSGFSQRKAFRFAFISDTHIGSPNGSSEEDLRRTVRDINAMEDIAFVVLTGDITELGTNDELSLAKKILDSLKVRWFIIPGNHDTGWSESGGVMFTTVFGYDKFNFEHNGVRFIGCASGPYVRMSDGHVPRDHVDWLDRQLREAGASQPLIFLNHYPIDPGLDNWYEVTDRLRRYNTWAILCGHGHANKTMNFEDIPAVMGRSNLRAKAQTGGYNLVDVRNDSLIFMERRPGMETMSPWTAVKIVDRSPGSGQPYDPAKKFKRPDYSINEKYPAVKEIWRYAADANIISTPAVSDNKVIVGNQNGKMVCLSLKSGKELWNRKAYGSIFSSPAIGDGFVVYGSGEGYIDCLDMNGKLVWSVSTGLAVLGSPLIHRSDVYIGGSDLTFRKFDLKTGKQIWEFSGLDGPVVSTPLLYNAQIIFGAWDRHLYSLDEKTGALNWKWNNGSSVINFSPASCIPVAHDGVIYIVAPDRYISAIDAADGKTLWRNNDATVRESIGISGDGKWVYGKTMQDTIVAYATGRDKQSAAWKLHVGFGYEHVPSMLIERDGQVFFGTKNGVVYSIDPVAQKINWAYKIDNSMVNTVCPLGENKLIASTMDGKIVLLGFND